jgi:hypothetical protein
MPTRYLKSGVRDSESIDKLSPLAETLFYRLLVTVDDFGRFDARPAMIKANCFPIKDAVNVNKCRDLISELKQNGLIQVYFWGDKEYLQMCKWDNKPRAQESKYPAPANNDIHLHTSVCNTYTDAPLTVTVTETKTETKTKTDITPDGVSQSVWEDFKNLRKAKKAPVTQRVIDGMREQADLAGWTLEKAMEECCIRGWQSFKAEWVADKPKLVNKFDVAHVTVPSSSNRDPALVKLDEDRKKAAPPNPEVLAKIRAVLGKTA